MEACLTEDDGPLLEAMAASRYAIGGAAFMERTEGQIERRRSGRLQDQDLDLLPQISMKPDLRPSFPNQELGPSATIACRPKE